MSRLPGVLLLSLVVVLLLALTGCGSQPKADQATPQTPAASQSAGSTDEWNTLLDQTLALENENAALQTEMSQLVQKFQGKLASASGAETVRSALKLLADAADRVDESKKNSESLSATWDEMAALNVSEAHNTYAGQQKKIAELQMQLDDLMTGFFAKERDVITQIAEAKTQADAEDASNKLGQLVTKFSADVAKLSARMEELKQEARKRSTASKEKRPPAIVSKKSSTKENPYLRPFGRLSVEELEREITETEVALAECQESFGDSGSYKEPQRGMKLQEQFDTLTRKLEQLEQEYFRRET
jgi:hypothetical protein